MFTISSNSDLKLAKEEIQKNDESTIHNDLVEESILSILKEEVIGAITKIEAKISATV